MTFVSFLAIMEIGFWGIYCFKKTVVLLVKIKLLYRLKKFFNVTNMRGDQSLKPKLF